ncbi:MAG: tetratricopeptide repeat protein [Verrucomicrobiales bacterium]|nr:tetratricopeptide repeat protein [Verrucomicrobiales bacterium]
MSDAIQRWQKVVAAQPTNDLARFSLAKALFDAERLAEAKEHLIAALDKKPDWMVVQILLGKCHLQLGDRTAAREAFAKAHQLAIAQHHEGPQAEMEQALAELE